MGILAGAIGAAAGQGLKAIEQSEVEALQVKMLETKARIQDKYAMKAEGRAESRAQKAAKFDRETGSMLQKGQQKFTKEESMLDRKQQQSQFDARNALEKEKLKVAAMPTNAREIEYLTKNGMERQAATELIYGLTKANISRTGKGGLKGSDLLTAFDKARTQVTELADEADFANWKDEQIASGVPEDLHTQLRYVNERAIDMVLSSIGERARPTGTSSKEPTREMKVVEEVEALNSPGAVEQWRIKNLARVKKKVGQDRVNELADARLKALDTEPSVLRGPSHSPIINLGARAVEGARSMLSPSEDASNLLGTVGKGLKRRFTSSN